MRGVAWDLKRRYATALLAGSSEKDQLLELIKRHNGWNFARELWDITYALDLVGQSSTFTCAAVARTCSGYVGDPSAANPDILLDIPVDVQAIVGGRVVQVGWGAAGDSFAAAQEYQARVDVLTFLTMDITGGNAGDSLVDVDARLAAYINASGYVYTMLQAGVNDIAAAASDISAAMLTTTESMIAKCLAEPTIPVLFTIPPFKNNVMYSADRITWSNNYDALLQAYAATNGYSVVDLRSVLSDDGETLKAAYDSGDGLHPNTDGYNAIGDAIAALGLDNRKMYTTDTGGNTLNPYTLKSTPLGTVKVFTAYATYAINTAYAAGVQVAITTTAGNRVYMQSSGGTSDATAVVIVDSDIGGVAVADNDINWSVLGYATVIGEQLEPDGDNYFLYSEQLQQANYGKANITITADNTVAPDGDTTADKVEVTAAAVTQIYQNVTGVGLTTGNCFSVFVKKGSGATDLNNFKLRNITTVSDIANCSFNYDTGVLTVVSGTCGVVEYPNGWWRIWLADDTINASDTLRGYIGAINGAEGAGEYIYAWGAMLSDGMYPPSYIPTTTVAVNKPLTSLSDTTAGRLSAESGAGRIVVSPSGSGQNSWLFESFTDNSNYIGILTTATTVVFRKRLLGVNYNATETYTHLANKPMVVEFYFNTTDGVNVRAFPKGTDPSGVAWHNHANTDDAAIAATFGLAGPTFTGFTGDYISCELSINKEDLNFE